MTASLLHARSRTLHPRQPLENMCVKARISQRIGRPTPFLALFQGLQRLGLCGCDSLSCASKSEAGGALGRVRSGHGVYGWLRSSLLDHLNTEGPAADASRVLSRANA